MLAINTALAGQSRLVALTGRRDAAQPWEVAVLVGCGLLASAAVLLLDFSLRIPGHAILRSVLPMSFGLALVPRRGAGATMGVSALLGLLIGGGLGYSAGTGATTSLLATGPLLDLAARQASRGWRLLIAFGAAGLLSNLLAFAVRGLTRLPQGGGGTGGRGGAGWWSVAPLSYAACGLIAGVVCAIIWFRWSTRSPQAAAADGEPS
jgi:hypothetical protein